MPTKRADETKQPTQQAAPAAPPAEEPPAPTPAEERTAEGWAEAKGMLPEFIVSRPPFARADAPPLRSHNPQFWRFAATRAGMGWPIGKELTEAEFDAAVTNATTGHQYR